MTTPNPFAGLTEAQHSHVSVSKNSEGRAVNPDDAGACQWDAIGILVKAGILGDTPSLFNDFLRRNYGFGIYVANQYECWTFAQFEAAWDEFMATQEAAQ